MKERFLINTKTRRIVYIEAGQRFVNELLSILTMPIGYIAKFLSESQSAKKVGSLTTLYQSREKLPLHGTRQSHLSEFLNCKYNIFDKNSGELGGGRCGVCRLAGQNSEVIHNIRGIDGGTYCCCGQSMDDWVEVGRGNSYVDSGATFLITDELRITASSIFNSRTILNQLNIEDFADLQEHTLDVDREKACKLVEASLVSKTLLNDAFGPELF